MPRGRDNFCSDREDSPSAGNLDSVHSGIVSSSTRRFVGIVDTAGKEILATASRKFSDLIPGDKVEFTISKTTENQAHITGLIDRTNCLKRSYFGKSKLLAANVRELWVVIAPPPLFNFKALDRTLAVAHSEDISVKILANKSDLETSSTLNDILEYYNNLGVPAIKTSALLRIGIEDCYTAIEKSDIIVVTGVSGVGKSSILKCILGEEIRTGQVSEKTGQGKQTTSSAQGYLYRPKDNPSDVHLLIDLPGIQSFGVSHLEKQSISYLMADINLYSKDCKYDNCSHVKETNCGVKEALENGTLMPSRYESFLEMTQEISDSQKY